MVELRLLRFLDLVAHERALDAFEHLAGLAGGFGACGLARGGCVVGAQVGDAARMGGLGLQHQEHETGDAREGRGREDGDLGVGHKRRICGERQVGHEDGHGEAHAAQDGGSEHVHPVYVLGQ